MKNRLQTLWDETVGGGPCPQPNAKQVRRRVDAALDGRVRAFQPRRALRYAVVCAAALVLLTGAAAASGVLDLPAHNVLSFFFRGENAPGSEQLVNAQPISVSDDNYTLTVTTSLADGNDVYFTLLIEAKTLPAQLQLASQNFTDDYPLTIDITRGSGSTSTHIGPYDPLTCTRMVEVDATRGRGVPIAVRLNAMEEGLWLRFTAQSVSDLTLRIDADGWGTGPIYDPDSHSGPLTLQTLTLSPLSCHMEYTADDPECYPVLHFLWADGTVSAMADLYGGHGSGHAGRRGEVYECDQTWPFSAVQDLSALEAVVFEGMAYPLDGGKPYEADVTTLPRREAGPAWNEGLVPVEDGSYALEP